MATFTRDAMPQVGARFFRADDELMFQFVIDAGNVVGPRLATKADSERHPEAWATFTAGDNDAPVEIVPDAREPQSPAPPETRVEEKDLDGFAARLEAAPERQKRKYTRKAA